MVPRSLTALCILCVLSVAPGTAQAMSYAAIDISALDAGITGPAEAKAISSDGKFVTGYATYADGQHVFLYNTLGNSYQDLGTNGTTGFLGCGVNGSGQIVARDGSNVGYYYSGGAWHTVAGTLQSHVPSGTVTYANPYAIDNSGMMLGGLRDDAWTGHTNQVGFEYTIGSSATVTIIPGINSANTTTATYGTALSSNGTCLTGQAGAAAGGSGNIHAFLFNGATTSDVGTLSGGTDTRGWGVNNAGTVVGWALPAGDINPYRHGFYATIGGVLHDLGSLLPGPGDPSGDVKPQGISNDGLAVGYSPASGGVQHAFAYDTAAASPAMVDLNTYLPGGSSWILNTADAITPDAIGPGNWVVGGGTYTGYASSRAFLLRPVVLPGDANLDGVVDINDLSKVLTNYDKSSMAWVDGDFNGDRTVDISDLSNVLTNYDKSASFSGDRLTAVPEPSGIALLAVAILFWIVRRR